jgi:L-ascorbate metabolism protein UlaG (beta-lactamase superfamily)
MKITYYGHACFGVEVNGKNLLFDPFISGNELAKNIDISKIKADYILISHGHEDHNADVASIAKRTQATLISNYEICVWFNSKHGVQNFHPMNHGGKKQFDFGTVKLVNAIHSSSLPDGSNGGNPCGFVIITSEGAFYFAGDTALTYDMKLIGEKYKLKFAMLPIGDNFTMDADDALTASDFIGCNTIIGMHYDTFGYIKINHNEVKEKFSKAGKKLHLIEIGKSISI